MAARKHKKVLGSLQPDIEDILDWNKLPDNAFEPASAQEKESFIQDRKSVSYWKDAWRRLRRNKVAMVAMVIVILIALFAFVGPMIVPYGYDEQIRGANNLHPWHYSLEDRMAQDPDAASKAARAEAEAEGRELTSIEEAQIRAKIKAGGTQELKPHLFGYTDEELQRKANGEFVFPMCSAAICTAATLWCVP